MSIEIRLLKSSDGSVLMNVAPDVFDGPVNARWCAEFLADARHHLAVALDSGCVVGMASAVHYVHPDKAPQLWINEVGVAPPYRRRGVAKQLLAALLKRAKELDCTEAWVLTEAENQAAMRLYDSLGGTERAPSAVMFEFGLEGGQSSASSHT